MTEHINGSQRWASDGNPHLHMPVMCDLDISSGYERTHKKAKFKQTKNPLLFECLLDLSDFLAFTHVQLLVGVFVRKLQNDFQGKEKRG